MNIYRLPVLVSSEAAFIGTDNLDDRRRGHYTLPNLLNFSNCGFVMDRMTDTINIYVNTRHVNRSPFDQDYADHNLELL